jgi:hypothetical protein
MIPKKIRSLLFHGASGASRIIAVRLAKQLDERSGRSTRSIGRGSRLGGEHEDDASLAVDLIKEAISADPVSPGFRLVSLQFPDILAEIGLSPELGINIDSELRDDGFSPSS